MYNGWWWSLCLPDVWRSCVCLSSSPVRWCWCRALFANRAPYAGSELNSFGPHACTQSARTYISSERVLLSLPLSLSWCASVCVYVWMCACVRAQCVLAQRLCVRRTNDRGLLLCCAVVPSCAGSRCDVKARRRERGCLDHALPPTSPPTPKPPFSRFGQ